MKTNAIETTAADLATATKDAEAQVPPGWIVVSRETLTGANPKSVTVEGETVEEARSESCSLLTANCSVIEQRVKREPGERTAEVSAYSEQEAEDTANLEAGEYVGSAEIVKSGRKGFLGIGRTRSTFRLHVVRKAAVQVEYMEQARVKFVIVEKAPAIQDTLERLAQLRTRWSSFRDFLPSPRELEDKVARDGPHVHMMALNAVEAKLCNEFANPLDAILEEVRQLVPDRKEISDLEALDLKPRGGISGLRYPSYRISNVDYRMRKVGNRLRELSGILSSEISAEQ